VKQLEHAIQHFPMLRRHADERLEMLAAPFEFEDQRRHLDRFRPGSEDAHHFYFAHDRFRSLSRTSAARLVGAVAVADAFAA
jgi:hypothetical protein